jgi:hypothetical protein
MAITLNGTTGITTPALDSQGVAVVNRTGDGTIIDLQAGGTTVGSIGTFGGDLIIGTNDIGLYFYDGATSVIPWKISTNAASDNYSDLGHPSYRWKDLYLGGGVYLGGTGSANHLDDYEEGTWTPIIKATGGSTTAALIATEPTYTKIGRLVYVSTYISSISWSDITDGGLVILVGLPYAANANNYGPIILSHNNTNIAGGYIENGGDTYFSNASGSEFAQASNSITGNQFMFAAAYNTTT